MIYLSGLALSLAVLMMHYEMLTCLSDIIEKKKRHGRHDMLIVVVGIIAVHLLEAMVFAVFYWFRTDYMGLDKFNIPRALTAFDYYYFSLETYTSIGYGDLYLLGKARFLSSLEAMVGLVLLGWSSSFMFLMMTRNWDRRLKKE